MRQVLDVKQLVSNSQRENSLYRQIVLLCSNKLFKCFYSLQLGAKSAVHSLQCTVHSLQSAAMNKRPQTLVSMYIGCE